MKGFYYLASPYSKHPRGKVVACAEAAEAAATCFRNNILVFSPIAHTHAISLAGNLPGHFEQWEDFDKAMINASAGVIVLELDGWQESVGIVSELEIASRLRKPVYRMKVINKPPVIR